MDTPGNILKPTYLGYEKSQCSVMFDLPALHKMFTYLHTYTEQDFTGWRHPSCNSTNTVKGCTDANGTHPILSH